MASDRWENGKWAGEMDRGNGKMGKWLSGKRQLSGAISATFRRVSAANWATSPDSIVQRNHVDPTDELGICIWKYVSLC